MTITDIILVILATFWAVGVLVVFVMAVRFLFEESVTAGVIAALVGLPVAALLVAMPFSMIATAAKPDLVTPKRGEWTCTESHRVGKLTKCYQYSRVQR